MSAVGSRVCSQLRNSQKLRCDDSKTGFADGKDGAREGDQQYCRRSEIAASAA